MKWIQCDSKNPPPRNTPMLVWITERKLGNWLREPPFPLWVYEDWANVGESGKDFSHYMIIDPPEEQQET